MRTPICNFVKEYTERNALRLHMPGHKGAGAWSGDITEIDGADSLYAPSGIIRESEENAGALFGCKTLYSTEGSSHGIRAMVYLAALHAKAQGKPLHILAGRNAHGSFISAACMAEATVSWLYGRGTDYLSCRADAAAVEAAILKLPEKPTALYITSPDYLGQTSDIRALAAVCRRHNLLFLVDNAHGAYLKFLPESRHPIDLGADMCCDSAHKTLPVLTGGAYLHISPSAPPVLKNEARRALALFGSTSPSYLILQSLDKANPYLAGHTERLASFLPAVEKTRRNLESRGFYFVGDEPQKLTVAAKAYGYRGTDLARLLAEANIICEFADPDFLVLMVTPETGAEGLDRLQRVLAAVPKRPEITEKPPLPGKGEQVLRIREALFVPREDIPAEESMGRILASPTLSCPPAVPIVAAGERIDEAAVRCFAYYGITQCTVVKEL